MNEPELKFDGAYNITTEGKITDGTNTYDINMSGQTPTGGYLEYENNTLKNGCITIDEYAVSIVNGAATNVEKGECVKSPKCIRATELHNEICSSFSCQNTGYSSGDKIEYGKLRKKGEQLVSGDAFNCDVNGDGEYNEITERFYYINDLYNTFTKKYNNRYAVLVYYNNTSNIDGNFSPDNSSSGLTAYYENGWENWHGPVTAINNLPTTYDWINVRLSSNTRVILAENNASFTSGGELPKSFEYVKKVNESNIPLAARLLTYKEVFDACGDGTSNNEQVEKCEFLLENTKYSNSGLGTDGFWSETPKNGDSSQIFGIFYSQGVLLYSGAGAAHKYNLGTRPAIEVLKTDIDY